MTNPRRFSLFLGLSLCLAACGSSPGTDAAVIPDSSAVDAAVLPDVGNDAFVEIDANDVDAYAPDSAVDAGPDAATTYCVNSADQTRIGMDPSIGDLVSMCGSSNFGGEPATRNCIESTSGLTMGCADCFDTEVACGVAHCIGVCAGGNTPTCLSCLHMFHCDSIFTACSGIAPP